MNDHFTDYVNNVILINERTPVCKFKVRVACTQEELNRGLQWVPVMRNDEAMLFCFPTVDHHLFWMKNTLIPLDLIFMNSAGVVVGVLKDMQPFDEQTKGCGFPSKYVLEVNSGIVDYYGIKRGYKMISNMEVNND